MNWINITNTLFALNSWINTLSYKKIEFLMNINNQELQQFEWHLIQLIKRSKGFEQWFQWYLSFQKQ